MLQSQLEVATNVHVDVNDAREELRFLRREVANVAAQYGFVIMACGTHPTAIWRMSQPSPKPRYEEMIEDLRSIGHRNMMCGMHVHVQLPDPEKRMAVMRAMLPHLPLFIALADLLAVLEFAQDRAEGLPARRLFRAAAHRPARTVRDQAGLRRLRRRAAAFRRDPRREPHLVGDAAVDEAPDPGASRARHLHLRRRRRRHRLALPLPDAAPLSAAASVEAGHRGRTRDCGREQMARPALRHRLHLCVQGRAGDDLGVAVANHRRLSPRMPPRWNAAPRSSTAAPSWRAEARPNSSCAPIARMETTSRPRRDGSRHRRYQRRAPTPDSALQRRHSARASFANENVSSRICYAVEE